MRKDIYMEGNTATLAKLATVPNEAFKKIIAAAATSKQGAIKCFNYLKKNFGIDGIKGFYNFLKKLFMNVSGKFKDAFAKTWESISKSIKWVVGLLKKSAKSINATEGDNGGSFWDATSDVYGKFRAIKRKEDEKDMAVMVVPIVLIGMIAATIIHPIFILIDIVVSGIGIAVLAKKESTSNFRALTRVAESYHLLEGPKVFDFMKAYINNMKSKAVELWKKIDKISTHSKVLALVSSVCVACIFCYIGMTKA